MNNSQIYKIYKIIFLSLLSLVTIESQVQAQIPLPKIPQAPRVRPIPQAPRVRPLQIPSPSVIDSRNPESCKNNESQCVIDLTKRLKNPDHLVRRFAAWELGERREKAVKAVPSLIEMLKKDSGKWERIHAAIALGKISMPLPEILPAFRVALNDSDKDVANQVATTIGQIAENMYTKLPPRLPESLSKPLSESEAKAQKEMVISELKAILKILQNPRKKFSPEPIKRVQKCLYYMDNKFEYFEF